MSFALAVMLVFFLGICAMGAAIGPAMIASGMTYLIVSGQDIGLAAETILNGFFTSFVLLAVPLFIFAANIMNAGTISDRLLDFSLAMVGRMRGGLAHVNIFTSLIFSGMSGSAIADAAGVGKVLIDMMRRENRYPSGVCRGDHRCLRRPLGRLFRRPFPWCSMPWCRISPSGLCSWAGWGRGF